jgi:DnaJ-class molecular chaperone
VTSGSGVTITTTAPEPCRCCNGSGVQKNKATGMMEVCQCCAGSGEWLIPYQSRSSM